MEIVIAIIIAIFLTIFIFFLTKRYSNEIAPVWWMIAFILKILAGIFLIFIYTNYYFDRNKADIFKYYDDGKILWNSSKDNPNDFIKIIFGIYDKNEYQTLKDKYLINTSNWERANYVPITCDNRMMIRINAILMPLTGGNYLLHMLFFVFLAFIGQFLFFKSINPYIKNAKLSFIIIFFFPSLVLWTSGVLKEALVMFLLGLWFFSIHKIITKRVSIFTIILFILVTILFFTVKIYIIIGLFLAIFPLIISKVLKKIEIWKLYLVFLLFYILCIPLIKWIFNLDLLMIVVNKLTLATNLAISENAGSLINPLNLKPTIFSFILNAPLALVNTLFRPFVTDLHNIIVIPAFIENVLWISFAIFTFIFHKKSLHRNNKLILFSFLLFALIEFLLIGYTTPIVGAIVRYRIFPLLFLLLSFVIIIDIEKICKKFKIKHL
jgi:hypothetical protein